MMEALLTGIGRITTGDLGQGEKSKHLVMSYGKLHLNQSKKILPQSNRFGRMDDYSKLGTLAIALALQDAGIDEWSEKRPIGVIATTVTGSLSADMDFFNTVIPQDGLLASPKLFVYTLPSSFLGEATIRFGLTGGSFVVNEEHPSCLSSIRMAIENISWGENEIMLAGFCELTPSFFGSEEKGYKPGAVFFVIEKNLRKCRNLYGRILCDNSGVIYFQDQPVKSLENLVELCLKSSSANRLS